jgi:hypothetical protein
VTHPFHPLHGHEFKLLEYRNVWGEDRVNFHDDTGKLRRLPATWTDVVGEDLFTIVGAGRSALRVDDLLRLVELVRGLGMEGVK